jgi:hypothetical protein
MDKWIMAPRAVTPGMIARPLGVPIARGRHLRLAGYPRTDGRVCDRLCDSTLEALRPESRAEARTGGQQRGP